MQRKREERRKQAQCKGREKAKKNKIKQKRGGTCSREARGQDNPNTIPIRTTRHTLTERERENQREEETQTCASSGFLQEKEKRAL